MTCGGTGWAGRCGSTARKILRDTAGYGFSGTALPAGKHRGFGREITCLRWMEISRMLLQLIRCLRNVVAVEESEV